MALIRLYMTMSLDGYVPGPHDSVDAPMGIDGFRLFDWLDRRNDPGPSGQVFSELMSTRAVIAGRRTYELAGRWEGDVMVHGAGAAQALLRAGELDELELHVVPVLLGQGRRLFDNLPAEHIELELTRRLTDRDVDPAHQVLHLRYRIRGPGAHPQEEGP